MLPFVDVSASHIVGMVVPSFQVHFLLPADDDFLARILFGDIRTLGVHVCHHDALPARVFLSSLSRQFSQKVVDTLRVAGVLHHIASKERYGEDDDFFSCLVGYGDDEVIEGIDPMSAGFSIVLAFSLLPDFPYVSSYFHVVSGEQRTGSLQSAGGIVVAGGNDDLHVRAQLGSIGKKLVINGLCRCRWISVIKDVSCYEESIGLLSSYLLQEPFQEMLVFRQTVVAVKQVAQMPVAGC